MLFYSVLSHSSLLVLLPSSHCAGLIPSPIDHPSTVMSQAPSVYRLLRSFPPSSLSLFCFHEPFPPYKFKPRVLTRKKTCHIFLSMTYLFEHKLHLCSFSNKFHFSFLLNKILGGVVGDSLECSPCKFEDLQVIRTHVKSGHLVVWH